jgi:hypothetical protein
MGDKRGERETERDREEREVRRGRRDREERQRQRQRGETERRERGRTSGVEKSNQTDSAAIPLIKWERKKDSPRMLFASR